MMGKNLNRISISEINIIWKRNEEEAFSYFKISSLSNELISFSFKMLSIYDDLLNGMYIGKKNDNGNAI